MDETFLRDMAMTVAVLGFFASAWFGWAQERPPQRWKRPLVLGSVVGMGTALVGGTVAWWNWNSGSLLSDDETFRTYLTIVGIEFGVAALGAVALAVGRRAEYLAPWICLVVGAHFYPMAPVLNSPGLYVLATVMTVVALAAVPVARRRELLPSAVTGAAAGSALLLYVASSAVAHMV